METKVLLNLNQNRYICNSVDQSGDTPFLLHTSKISFNEYHSIKKTLVNTEPIDHPSRHDDQSTKNNTSLHTRPHEQRVLQPHNITRDVNMVSRPTPYFK